MKLPHLTPLLRRPYCCYSGITT